MTSGPADCRTVWLRAAVAAALFAASHTLSQAQERSGTTGYRMLDAARGAAVTFATSLPDYIVKRTVTRYQGRRSTLRFSGEVGNWTVPAVDRWKLLDSITADVAAEHGREVYTNVAINGKPTKTVPAGTWSTGEFSGTLLQILSPESATGFTNERLDTIRNRQAYRYDYLIDQPHSLWHITSGRLPAWPGTFRYTPAYSGEIWVDSRTAQVLRIEQMAQGLPNTFPLDVILEATDYDYVEIAGHEYCLPTDSEAVSCQWGPHNPCWRNETAFTGYDKFDAKTTITFEGNGK